MKFLNYAYDKINNKTEFPPLRNRMFSTCIDLLIVYLLLYPLNYFFMGLLPTEKLQFLHESMLSLGTESPAYQEKYEEFSRLMEPKKNLILIFQLVQLLGLSLYLLLSWFYVSSTPGKMIMGMKILDFETRKKPSFKQLLIRFIVGIPSAGFLMLGFLWANFNKYHRALHDIASGTIIVRWNYKENTEKNVKTV